MIWGYHHFRKHPYGCGKCFSFSKGWFQFVFVFFIFPAVSPTKPLWHILHSPASLRVLACWNTSTKKHPKYPPGDLTNMATEIFHVQPFATAQIPFQLFLFTNHKPTKRQTYHISGRSRYSISMDLHFFLVLIQDGWSVTSKKHQVTPKLWHPFLPLFPRCFLGSIKAMPSWCTFSMRGCLFFKPSARRMEYFTTHRIHV